MRAASSANHNILCLYCTRNFAAVPIKAHYYTYSALFQFKYLLAIDINKSVQWNDVYLWIGGPKLDSQHRKVFLSRFHWAHTEFGTYPACCTTDIGIPFRGWSAHILWLTAYIHLVVWGHIERRIVGWSPLSYIQDMKRSFSDNFYLKRDFMVMGQTPSLSSEWVSGCW